MRRSTRRHHGSCTPRGGFSLIEMMVLIVLLATAALLGSRLFSASMGSSRQVNLSERRTAALDHAMRLLRQDVWQAQSVARDAQGWVLLRMDGDIAVRWSPDDDGSLRRQVVAGNGSPDATRTIALDAAVRMEPHPAGLLIEVDGAKALLSSQVMLAAAQQEARP